MMKKILIAALLCLLLAACASSASLPADGATIPWEQAVQLLHDGQVSQIFQAHSLQVTLTLSNGATITTIEPSIDEIFFEVERCGAPCAGIPMATE
jgi:hypothetical protein